MVGLGRFELPTSPLSGVRSNQLSYRPRLHGELAGGADRDRTGDPLLAKQVLSQLSYSPLELPPVADYHRGLARNQIRPQAKLVSRLVGYGVAARPAISNNPRRLKKRCGNCIDATTSAYIDREPSRKLLRFGLRRTSRPGTQDRTSLQHLHLRFSLERR
jgi:hypothetical protein